MAEAKRRPPNRPKRQKKADKLRMSTMAKEEVLCDQLLAPLDGEADRMDAKWGIDVLPELVTQETADKYATCVAELYQALEDNDPHKVSAWVQGSIRGLQAMDAEAERLGAERASLDVFEIVLDDGIKYVMLRDIRSWPTLKERYPEHKLVSTREVGLALHEYSQSVVRQTMELVRDFAPKADIKEVRR